MAAQDPCRILVMASGNGSNFQALIDAVAGGSIPDSRIVRLIVNRAKAYATTRAEKAGIPWEYVNLIGGGFLRKGETDPEKVAEARRAYDAALAEKVLAMEERPELVVLAGWMHVFSAPFLEPLQRAGIKVINLHPALPGEYDGAGAIERAHADLTAGKTTRTGIMVHYVVLQVDRGDAILTHEVPFAGETLPELEEKIHACEHDLIVRAAAKVVGEIIGQRAK